MQVKHIQCLVVLDKILKESSLVRYVKYSPPLQLQLTKGGSMKCVLRCWKYITKNLKTCWVRVHHRVKNTLFHMKMLLLMVKEQQVVRLSLIWSGLTSTTKKKFLPCFSAQCLNGLSERLQVTNNLPVPIWYLCSQLKDLTKQQDKK